MATMSGISVCAALNGGRVALQRFVLVTVGELLFPRPRGTVCYLVTGF